MGEIRTATQRQRDKIRSGMIINKLMACVKGEITMSPSQVNAARILLNKTLPDMKSVELSATVKPTGTPAYELTDEQLLAIASGALNVVPIQPVEKAVVEVRAIEAQVGKQKG